VGREPASSDEGGGRVTVLLPYRGIVPRVAADVFLAPNASVIGDVEIGEGSGIWFGAVLRGDVMAIRIGARTSIQDNCVLHATGGWAATHVGRDCTIGHAVVLHGCAVGDRVLVGMGSIVLDAAEIGSDTILGAGSVVTPRTKLPSGVLAVGRPAKVVRELREEDLARIREAAELYVGYAREYRTGAGG
jgi:carbonic anhydrase/acetyltransferase-like protein (isoleucine patch superfamily)